MLKIEKFVTMSPEQYEIVIEGMRNPKNSWDRMDSNVIHCWADNDESGHYDIGPNDHALMMSLADGGPVHAKYRRMMPVWATIVAPLYWWKEFDTYKVGTVSNSCSTMHKIHAKEFTMDDFSTDHIANEYMGYYNPATLIQKIIGCLNEARKKFLDFSSKKEGQRPYEEAKRYWWQMIQLLPTSYNQKRTVFLNYEVLHNIYVWRQHHKLTEWHTFCDWIKELPYSELITMEDFE